MKRLGYTKLLSLWQYAHEHTGWLEEKNGTKKLHDLTRKALEDWADKNYFEWNSAEPGLHGRYAEEWSDFSAGYQKPAGSNNKKSFNDQPEHNQQGNKDQDQAPELVPYAAFPAGVPR
jgi:nicotinamidase-related amidase